MRDEVLLLLLEGVEIAEFELCDLVAVSLLLGLELLTVPPVKPLKLV